MSKTSRSLEPAFEMQARSSFAVNPIGMSE
jgi:hypothetical protein